MHAKDAAAYTVCTDCSLFRFSVNKHQITNMVRCTVFGCDNITIKGSGTSFHRFPHDEPRRQRWINYCHRVDPVNLKPWQPSKTSVMCSAHFTKPSFISPPSFLQLLPHMLPTKSVLKSDAVPNVPFSASIRPTDSDNYLTKPYVTSAKDRMLKPLSTNRQVWFSYNILAAIKPISGFPQRLCCTCMST